MLGGSVGPCSLNLFKFFYFWVRISSDELSMEVSSLISAIFFVNTPLMAGVEPRLRSRFFEINDYFLDSKSVFIREIAHNAGVIELLFCILFLSTEIRLSFSLKTTVLRALMVLRAILAYNYS